MAAEMKYRYEIPLDENGNYAVPIVQDPNETFCLRVIGGVGVYDSTVEHPELLEHTGVQQVEVTGVIEAAKPVCVDETPDMGWSREKLNKYAECFGIDHERYSTKRKLLAAIEKASG